MATYRVTEHARNDFHPPHPLTLSSEAYDTESTGGFLYPDGHGAMREATPREIAQWVADGLLEEVA